MSALPCLIIDDTFVQMPSRGGLKHLIAAQMADCQYDCQNDDQLKEGGHRAECTRYESLGLEDAEVVAVAYGANARTVKTGVVEARRRGVRAGFCRQGSLSYAAL